MDNKKIIQEIPKIDPEEVKSGKWKIGDISYDQDGDTKFTVTDLDKTTGSVQWGVKKLPAFDKLFDDSTELVNTAKGVYQKAKNDDVIKQIYTLSKDIRNKVRTHLRNDYPDEYKRIVMKMNEEWDDFTWEVDENTTTGGGAGSAGFTPGTGMTYATPYAFKRTKKKQKPIPESLKESKDPGATLGPGPKASADGVNNSSYTSQFGYKLVPKNKDGTYVQKGSGMVVKKLN